MIIKNEILSIYKFLSDNSLTIPEYQRPYKWMQKNVEQLFRDIVTHANKSAYRLGTIVLHRDTENNNIVNIIDGQQRTITLLLAVKALCEVRKDKLNDESLQKKLNKLTRINHSFKFKSNISRANIRNNYVKIKQMFERSDFAEEHIDFLLNQCEVVTFTLNDVSEAFQFFDSQNARGRDLEPHDLLKAYHLREFRSNNEQLKANIVAKWENSKIEELKMLFSEYLYRIRNWPKGDSARTFTKEHTNFFKGISEKELEKYPYAKQLHIAHQADEDTFPFHLDQTIVNGRRFFEMIAHYQEMVNNYNKHFSKLNGHAPEILGIINCYKGCTRTGDQYVRNIFDCLLIYYIDKFGHKEISRSIKKIFIWAYNLRLDLLRVGWKSINSYVRGNNLFKLIKEAIRPSEFINWKPSVLTENRFTKTKEIAKLFKKMGYLEKINE